MKVIDLFVHISLVSVTVDIAWKIYVTFSIFNLYIIFKKTINYWHKLKDNFQIAFTFLLFAFQI